MTALETRGAAETGRPAVPRPGLMGGDWVIYALFFFGLALTAVVIIYPAFYAIELSFQKAESFISEPEWAGLDNYARVLNDPEFWSALQRGFVFAGTAILFQVVLGIGFAMLLDAAIPMKRLVRGVAILPYLLPTLIVALTFRWMLNDPIGVITVGLDNLGFGIIDWFGSTTLAMILVIAVSVWIWTPFVTVAFLAGLQSVPETLYEAAKVDGANAWQRFWHITLPQLSPVLTVVVLLRAIWMFNKFDIIWLMTGGGPLQATEHLPILAYRKAFQSYDVGMGATVSTISFLILTVGVLVYFRLFPLDTKD